MAFQGDTVAVRFGLLGEVTLHLDGERRQIPGPKAGVLLASLLLRSGLPVSVDRLAATVWGARPPRTAHASLHNHFSRLRSALGPERDRLRAARGAYALDIHAGELDAEVFASRLRRAQEARRALDWKKLDEETSAALALWRGQPVSQYPSLHESPEVVHLAELHLQAVELRFEARIRTGRHHAITAELTRYAADHPLREPFHRQLMTALHRADRTADAIAAYHRLRRNLADELGIDPAPSTQQIFGELLAPSTIDGDVHSDGAGQAAAPVSPAMFQTPRDIVDFTGRTAELAILRERLRSTPADSVPPVVVISGMGGVGKTTLALHAAHATRAAFPGGQLYADLRGFGSGTPRTPHDLLARFLIDLGVPAQSLPEDTDDRAALYRATLAERRILIMLDNARDAKQVTPLLIGSGTGAVIVTSRHALTGLSPATHITLQPFGDAEQQQLLAAICGPDRLSDEQPATERILAACAGLPLALRIVGARLAQPGSTTLGAVADRLDEEGRRLTALSLDHLNVSDVFRMSYQALRAGLRQAERDAATAFRRLGLWSCNPFSAEAASALLDRPVEQTRDLLDILVGAHLLQNPTPCSYRFHDLLGDFALQCAETEESADEREAALLRMVSWYCAALHRADTLTQTNATPDLPPRTGTRGPLPEFADANTALAWISQELPAILSAIRAAADSTRPELAWHTAHYLFGWIQTNWWTGLWEQPVIEALATARREGDLTAQAHMHKLLGIAYGVSYRNEPSLSHLDEAAALYERLGNTERQAATLGNYAHACLQAGRIEEGLTVIRQAIHLHEDSRPLPMPILHTHGALLLGSGDAGRAEESFRQCLTLCHTENRTVYLPIVLVNLGDALRAQGRRDEAFTHLEESLKLASDVDNHFLIADALEALARAHIHFGDPDQARSCWQKALAIAEQHRLDRVIHDCLAGLDALADVT